MPTPPVIREARPTDWPAVAAWTFAHVREPFAGLRAARLVRLIVDGELSPAGLLVAVRGDTAVGGIAVQYLPGGTAVVMPPGGESEAVRAALVAAAVARLPAAGMTQGQAFVDPGDEGRAAVLSAHGFGRLTAVVQMELPLPARLSAPPVRLAPYSAADPARFADVLLATYRDSLDVPEANVGRPAADILAGYRGGRADPPDWWLAEVDGRPAGVLLLSAEGPGETELAYLGVVPEARGRSVGRALLAHAVGRAAEAGHRAVALTCDERNAPALRLYDRAGFRRRQRQVAYLWRADGQTRPRPVAQSGDGPASSV